MKDALGHGSDARGEGQAAGSGDGTARNPYQFGDPKRLEWEHGWTDAVGKPGAQGGQVLDSAPVTDALGMCRRLASMAGEPRPSFVNWGHVYSTPDGNFRMVASLRDTGKSTFEKDDGRLGRLPKGKTFHDLAAHVERVR